MAEKKKPTPPLRGPKDPAALERAVQLCLERGMLPQEVVELPELKGRVAWRTVYLRLTQRREGKAPAAPPAPPAPPAAAGERPPSDRPASAPPVRVTAPPVPDSLSGPAARLWIIRHEIRMIRDALAEAHATKNLARVGPLTGQLRELLDEEARLEPPRKRTSEEEAAEYEQEARNVVTKIEAAIARAEERVKL